MGLFDVLKRRENMSFEIELRSFCYQKLKMRSKTKINFYKKKKINLALFQTKKETISSASIFKINFTYKLELNHMQPHLFLKIFVTLKKGRLLALLKYFHGFNVEKTTCILVLSF